MLPRQDRNDKGSRFRRGNTGNKTIAYGISRQETLQRKKNYLLAAVSSRSL